MTFKNVLNKIDLCVALMSPLIQYYNYIINMEILRDIIVTALAKAKHPLFVLALQTRFDTIQHTKDFWNSALQCSAKYGDVCMVSSLLAHPANININARKGKALRLAAEHNHSLVVFELLKNGANVGANDALCTGAANNCLCTVLIILQYKEQLKIDGNAALIMSSQRGYDKIVQALMKYGVKARSNNNVALIESAHGCHARVVKILLENGADVRARDDGALEASVSESDGLETVKVLLQYNANVNAKDGLFLASSLESGNFAIAAELLKYGADVHAGNDRALKWLSANFSEQAASVLSPYCNIGDR